MQNFSISYGGLGDNYTEIIDTPPRLKDDLTTSLIPEAEENDYSELSSSSSSSSSSSLFSEFEERSNDCIGASPKQQKKYERELALRDFEREASGDFALLDDEVVLNIFKFLKPEDVLNVGQTCRRLNKLSKDPVMWDDVSSKTPWKSNIFGTYSYYKDRLKSYRFIKKKEQSLIEERSLKDVGVMLSKKLIYMCNAFTERACVWCILLQTIFFVQKLDHDIDWKWAVVFIPSYIILALFIPCSFFSMIMSFASGRYGIKKFYDDNTLAPIVFAGILGYPLAKGRKNNNFFRVASTALFFAHALLFTFVILMILKLDGNLDIEWSIIFIFVYPFLIIQTLLVALAIDADEIGLFEFMALWGIMTFITLLLFGLYLDELIICSVQLIFIPAYVLAVLAALLAAFHRLHNEESYDFVIRILGVCGSIFLVSFLGPLGQTLNGINDKKFATCYIGIFLLEAILIIFHLLLSFVSCLFHIDDED